MLTLNQDIKNQSWRRMYLLFGEEAFLRNSYKQRLKDGIIGEDTMNYAHFEGKGIDIPELISLADTLPFFAERRLILVEDSGFFKGSPDALVDYLPSLPESTCLVFVESEVDKRSRLYKKVKELGYAAELGKQTPDQLSRWVLGLLSREGKKITGSTMELFLSKTGDDMENIRMEVEKLVCYTMGREVITSEDVEAICTTRVANKIFDMISAISSGRTRQAMDLYQDLLTLKEPPMRILFLIARQFNQLMQVKEMMKSGFDKAAIASKLKMQPFVVGKCMPQARTFTDQQLKGYVEACADYEESVKTGHLADTLAVELLIYMYRR